MRDAWARSLSAVPRGKRGVLSLGVTHVGAEVSLGWRVRRGVTVSGYGSGLWRGPWMGGVKGEWTW
jgi:hypothetical protein